MYWNSKDKTPPKKNLIFFAANNPGSDNNPDSMFGGSPPYELRDLCRKCKADLVVVCEDAYTKQLLESEAEQKWLDEALLGQYVAEILCVDAGDDVENNTDSSRKVQIIRQYLGSHDHAEYVIVDHKELEPEFPGHTVYIETFSRADAWAWDADRILKYPPFGSDNGNQNAGNMVGGLIDDHISKAIFLDIDGVLNDDGERRNSGEIIFPEYVKNLAIVVEQTGAEIILSSSWRYGLARIGCGEPDHDIMVLLNEFAKYHLRIAGMTPLCFNGPDGRPFEVRLWLARRPDLESFVILDDEDFWRWLWLSDRVVLTAREIKDKSGWRNYIKGFDSEHAQKAIEILNRR